MKLQVTHKLINVDKKLMIYTGLLELTETTVSGVAPATAAPAARPLKRNHPVSRGCHREAV